MTNEETKNKVKLLITELLEVPSEEREEIILVELDKLSPDPGYTDYLYHSCEYEKTEGEIDIDAVIEKIFSYKAIQL